MPNVSPFTRRIAPWLALVGLALLTFVVMRPFFVSLAWACVLAYVSWPLVERLRKRCNGRDTLAASLATFLMAFTICAPLLTLLWVAQQEISGLYAGLREFVLSPPDIPDFLKNVPGLGDWLMSQREQLLAEPQGLSESIKAWLASHLREAAQLAGVVGKDLAQLGFVIMILFFLYRDGESMVHEFRHVMARFIGQRTHGYVAAAASTTRAVVYGILLTALVQGTFAGVGYWLAGLGSPVSMGILTALFALIPFATPVAWGSAGAWLLFDGEIGAAIGVWIWGAAVVSQIDNVLRPIFISSVSEIPFLLVLFGVLGGLMAFGLVGLFAGPIVLAVAWAVWREWGAHLDEEVSPEE